MQNHLNENVFHQEVPFNVNQTHQDLHMKGFAQGPILKQRPKITQILPICKVTGH